MCCVHARIHVLRQNTTSIVVDICAYLVDIYAYLVDICAYLVDICAYLLTHTMKVI